MTFCINKLILNKKALVCKLVAVIKAEFLLSTYIRGQVGVANISSNKLKLFHIEIRSFKLMKTLKIKFCVCVVILVAR
jgi:hypothetical protein